MRLNWGKNQNYLKIMIKNNCIKNVKTVIFVVINIKITEWEALKNWYQPLKNKRLNQKRRSTFIFWLYCSKETVNAYWVSLSIGFVISTHIPILQEFLWRCVWTVLQSLRWLTNSSIRFCMELGKSVTRILELLLVNFLQ